MATESKDHWQAHAQQWSRIGSPLRPSDEDVALMAGWLGERPGHGLLLGVTAELTALSDSLLAQDRDGAMIARLWRPRTPQQTARQADWLDAASDDTLFDFAAGDGSINAIAYADEYSRLFARLRERLHDKALLVLRVFCTPEQGETPEAVLAAARQGGIGSFHAFKWRLAMAIVAGQGDPNIRVHDIREQFQALVAEADRAELAAAAGWLAADIDTIDVYRDSPTVYSFPTRSQLRAALPSYCEEIGSGSGTYELAERCPVIAFRFHR
jgi:hypothetical protein